MMRGSNWCYIARFLGSSANEPSFGVPSFEAEGDCCQFGELEYLLITFLADEKRVASHCLISQKVTSGPGLPLIAQGTKCCRPFSAGSLTNLCQKLLTTTDKVLVSKKTGAVRQIALTFLIARFIPPLPPTRSG